MSRKQQIILIDDDKEYCKELKQEAQNFNLKIKYFHNLEAGIKAIENNRKIKAVILDGHCPIDEYQAPETAKSNFVSHAIHRLTDIEHIHNRFVPFCINSANPDDFREDLEGITLVFRKNKDHKEMFNFIKQEINQLPETQIINEYDDIFDFFENYFNAEDEELLIKLLAETFNEDLTTFISKLSILRRLEERLFDIISANYFGQDPLQINSKNMSRTKNIIFRLKNQRKLPLFLFDFAMDIYSLSSKYGAHNFLGNHDFMPTKYTVNSLIFSFLELCLWAEQLIENQK